MTAAQVLGVARELARRRGARVVTVHQDTRSRFRLVLEHKGRREDLVLDVDRAWPRIHLEAPRRAPARPTPLASGLRRQIASSRLEGARAVRGERAVGIAVVRGGNRWTVWFEAFGRGANLYLVDPDGVVRLTPRGEVARRRDAAVGQVFTARPPRAGPARPTEPKGDAEPSRAVREEAACDTRLRAEASRRAALRRALAKAGQKVERAVRRLEEARGRAEEAERLLHEARLLQASFHRLRPGLASVTLEDHEADGREVEVALDPHRPPGEQIAARFRRGRKLLRGVEEAGRRLEDLAARRDALRRLEGLTDGPLETFEAAARAEGVAPPVPREARRPSRARPWREYRSIDGWRILVGRDAKGNDRLTTREARPHDRWLHVRGAAGSHVVVPTPPGKTVPLGTLLDAAELAVHFSDRRGAPRAEVDHVERRHVAKPRKAPPGTVVLQQAKTLLLESDPARRDRLLTTGPRAP
jgi:predicted ribosome quality control (RQC) complex YloA/Tae2 family protein